MIEKIIYEDIAVIYNLRQPTLPILKKIIWLVATSKGLSPNIDKISKNLQVSREMIYHCFDYLAHSGLINNIHYDALGMKLVRKPGKVYIENTNLLSAINGHLTLAGDTGSIRETFFVNQVSSLHSIHLHDHGDFLIDRKYVFEVGGKSKNFQQVQSIEEAYLALDNIEIGFGKKIPLYIFGLLY